MGIPESLTWVQSFCKYRIWVEPIMLYDIYIYIYILTYLHTYIYIYIYVYIYIYCIM